MAKKRASAEKASKAKKPKTTKQAKAEDEKKLEFEEKPGVQLLNDQEIDDLADAIKEENKYNNLVVLLDQYGPLTKLMQESEELEAYRLTSVLTNKLYKTFKILIIHGQMRETKDEKKNLVASWLRDKYDRFRGWLCWLVKTRLRRLSKLDEEAMNYFLKLMKEEFEARRVFLAERYHELVSALLTSEVGSLRADKTSDYPLVYTFSCLWNEHPDLQVHFFDNILAKNFEEWSSLEGATKDKIFANFWAIIKDGLSFTDPEGPYESYASMETFKLTKEVQQKYQECFLASVRMLELSGAHYRMILNSLHFSIIPNFSSPAALMDFLTDAIDQEEDEIVPLLALNSLWYIMKEYNLEYPDFYKKLYSLLTSSLLYTRYRARFFRLLDLFLSSTHLSASLVASFIKRLARVAITASAPGVVIVFPFIYNLLKRHPSCMIMLQNQEGLKNPDYKDPFDEKETDPQKTGALGSSLWELETLQSHYHPNIATLAKIFSEPFRKPSYNLEDFLDWTYKSLLDSEEKRRYKGLAALEYEQWETLFGHENAFMNDWEL